MPDHETAPDAASPKKPLCFVIGPIGETASDTRKRADLLFNLIIKPAIEPLNYRVKRADEDTTPGMISDTIMIDLRDAKLVVADLSELNPNAFYELGIRHARIAPTIHMAPVGMRLPFDNAGYRAIRFDVTEFRSIEDAKRELQAHVQATEQPGYKPSNPITHANAMAEVRDSKDPESKIVAELLDRVSHLENTVRPPAKSSSDLRLEELGRSSKPNVLLSIPLLKQSLIEVAPRNISHLDAATRFAFHRAGFTVEGLVKRDTKSVDVITSDREQVVIEVRRYPPLEPTDIAVRLSN